MKKNKRNFFSPFCNKNPRKPITRGKNYHKRNLAGSIFSLSSEPVSTFHARSKLNSLFGDIYPPDKRHCLGDKWPFQALVPFPGISSWNLVSDFSRCIPDWNSKYINPRPKDYFDFLWIGGWTLERGSFFGPHKMYQFRAGKVQASRN